MAESKSVDTDDIEKLLTLDPSRPDEALRLRIGIARLAGYEVYPGVLDDDHGGWLDPWYFDEDGSMRDLPHVESSLDAALTLPIADDCETSVGTWGNNAQASILMPLLDNAVKSYEQFYYHVPRKQPAEAYCKAWLRYKQAEVHLRLSPDYRAARGALRGIADDEPAEDAIRRLRDGEDSDGAS